MAWGPNNIGNLGTNNTTQVSTPVQVGTLTNWSKGKLNGLCGFAIKTDGGVKAVSPSGDDTKSAQDVFSLTLSSNFDLTLFNSFFMAVCSFSR